MQQVKRNRNTSYARIKTGFDYNIDAQNPLTVPGLFNREKSMTLEIFLTLIKMLRNVTGYGNF